MTAPDSPVPTDLDTLRAALAAERQARLEAEARASGTEAMIAHLKLMIAKLRHDRFGASSERGRKLLDQLELELEEAETAASEVDTQQPDTDTTVRPVSRRKGNGSLSRPPPLAPAAAGRWPSWERRSPRRWR